MSALCASCKRAVSGHVADRGYCACCRPETAKHSPHGLARYIALDCRCDTCVAAHDDAAELVHIRVEDHPYSDRFAKQAREMGVSTERAYQMTVTLAPWRPWDAIRTEREAVLAEVEQERRKAMVACFTCGENKVPATNKTVVYCSGFCRHVACDLLAHARRDRKSQLKHYRAIAEWGVRSGADLPSYAERFHERVLSGQTPHYRGRWFVEGSKAHRVAQYAVAAGWPIVDHLHPELVETLRREVAA